VIVLGLSANHLAAWLERPVGGQIFMLSAELTHLHDNQIISEAYWAYNRCWKHFPSFCAHFCHTCM